MDTGKFIYWDNLAKLSSDWDTFWDFAVFKKTEKCLNTNKRTFKIFCASRAWNHILMHLVEIIIFSLYHVIVRPTKIAKVWFSNLFFSVEQKCEIFLGFSLYRNQLCRRICFETFSNRYNANTVFSKNVPTLEIVLVGLIRAQGCNQW